MIIALSTASLISFIALIVYYRIANREGMIEYDKQLAELLYEEADDEEINKQPAKKSLITKWNEHWAEGFSILGLEKYGNGPNVAGRNVILVSFIICGILFVLMKNIFLSIFLTILLVYVFNFIIRNRKNKKAEEINAQLPGFLFAMKANIQANETPERSLLKIVDQMPKPLYDELYVVKQRILANSTFSSAITELETKTSSRDLKFLCACMKQAAESGANMEQQITVIQDVLVQRQKVTNEIQQAVSAASPAIWLASITIPAVFVITTLFDSNAKAFWFKEPISWAILAVVIMLYALGIWLSRKFVDNIKNT